MTANIFLRELRGVWPKAQPVPSDPATLAAWCLGLLGESTRNGQRALVALQRRWKASHPRGVTFVDFEVALVRLGLGYCRKRKHDSCPLATWCLTADRARVRR